MKTSSVWVMLAIFALCSAGVATANPVMIIAIAETVAPGQVSVFNCPDGGGKPITEAYYRAREPGVTPNVVDATITVTVMDDTENPIVGLPAVDIWIETTLDGLVFCPFGNIADHETDLQGQTQFTQPFRGGGATDPDAGERTLVMVMGEATWNPPLDIQFNSSDMNGDLVVDLADIVDFVGFWGGDYDYAADFHWDGALNLTDIVLLAESFGSVCP